MPLLPLLGDPNANRSLIQWVDWAGQWPEGRTSTPTPSRKKERDRFGDVLVACSRTLVLSQAVHYVDDYGSMGDSKSAHGSFSAFEEYNGCLPISMKQSKRQPPERHQRIQGVLISSDTDNLILTPCPKRVQRTCRQISEHLKSNTLSPEEARKMAGKCNFLTGRLFGKVGRAPLKALYARANSNSCQLDKPPVHQFWHSETSIILHCRPMTIPRIPCAPRYSVIYTDAYFKLGEQVYRPGDEDIPKWESRNTAHIENGWAAVCFHQGDVQRTAYFQGRLPTELVKIFSSDQAFIYLLEAWAAILAPLIFEPWLDSFYVQCCDNEASRHALIKGVGKRQPLNCLIAAHWTWRNRRGIAHRLERVPTKAKISDGLSRFEDIPESVHWLLLDLPLEALTTRAKKIVGDIEFASKIGFADWPEVVKLHKILRMSDQ